MESLERVGGVVELVVGCDCRLLICDGTILGERESVIRGGIDGVVTALITGRGDGEVEELPLVLGGATAASAGVYRAAELLGLAVNALAGACGLIGDEV